MGDKTEFGYLGVDIILDQEKVHYCWRSMLVLGLPSRLLIKKESFHVGK
jgi:hypothetical protein